MDLKVTLYGPPDDKFVFPTLMPVVHAMYPEHSAKIIEYLGRDFVDRACEPDGIEYPTITDTTRLAEGINQCVEVLLDEPGPFNLIILQDEEGFEVGSIRG